MGQAVAEAVVRAGLPLVPYTLCVLRPGQEATTLSVAGTDMTMVLPHERDEVISSLMKQYPGMITVDYTLPDTIHDMVDFYVRHGTPFVMGTTGGDRSKMLEQVSDAGLYSVIAPNMAKQIVMFQATLAWMTSSFHGGLDGYTLRVVESHQSSKKDTSGTAKAFVESFQHIGMDFDVGQIELIRTEEEQMSVMNVPESALQGHAFHTYQLLSADKSVEFEFKHNVSGRSIYAEGTVDAVKFLAQRMAAGSEQKVYNMIDVLKQGSMR
ncbi:MAG: hypothetical protein WDW38_005566 [Sanguina aurantia]